MHPEAAELARLVMAMQEERAETYAKLRAAHRTYLASGGGGGGGGYDLETYKVAVDAATKAFQLSSQTAMDLRKKCDKEGGCGDLKKVAGMIERLQVLEERKLKFTVDHQLAQQEVQEHPDDDLQVCKMLCACSFAL